MKSVQAFFIFGAATVTFALLYTVKATVAEVCYVPTNVVAPDVPKGARVLVFKLTWNHRPGQVIAYRAADGSLRLGKVAAVNAAAGELSLTRNSTQDPVIKSDDVVGRVVLSTR